MHPAFPGLSQDTCCMSVATNGSLQIECIMTPLTASPLLTNRQAGIFCWSFRRPADVLSLAQSPIGHAVKHGKMPLPGSFETLLQQ